MRVLSGSNYQWFNRLIKDDEPYLGLIPWLRDMEHPRKGRGANGLVGGLGALKIPRTDPGHEATEAGTGFFDGVFGPRLEQAMVALHAGVTFANPFASEFTITNFLEDFFHGFFGTGIDDAGSATDVTVFGGLGDGKAHSCDT